jgi:FkbM family methyltransferase
MQFGKSQLKRCKYGWMLFSGPYIGKCFELYGQYSESEIRIFRSFIRPGDTALDIGANIGDLTVPMSLCVGEAGRVYAIESHTDSYHTLCANLALNNIVNTRAINAFIAHSDRTDTSGPWGPYGYVSKNFQPPIIPVDSLNLPACAFMKIDVDGKELEVLRSAGATIARTRPIIYLENDIPEKSSSLLEHLFLNDYVAYWHRAPIFDADNFFGNPINHWPGGVMSLMVLCIPKERAADFTITLKPVSHQDEWWD